MNNGMLRRSPISGLIASGVVLVAVAAWPSSAAAKEVTRSQAVAAGKSAAITVICPSTGHMRGEPGIKVPFDANHIDIVTGLTPILDKTSTELRGATWTVFNASRQSATVVVDLECTRHHRSPAHSHRLYLVKDGQVVASHHQGHATVTCPSGKTVVFGGFQASRTSAAGLRLNGLVRRRPNNWTATAENPSEASDKLTSVAVCSTGPSLTQVKKKVTILPSTSDAQVDATATCTRGTDLLSGFRLTPSADLSSTSPEIFFDHFEPTLGSITAGGYTFTHKRTETVSAIAYCG